MCGARYLRAPHACEAASAPSPIVCGSHPSPSAGPLRMENWSPTVPEAVIMVPDRRLPCTSTTKDPDVVGSVTAMPGYRVARALVSNWEGEGVVTTQG